MKAVASLFLLIAPAILSAANLQFAGYSKTSKDTQFVINDLESGVVSPWLKIGQSFRGYKIDAFDAQKEVLSVVGPAGVLHLPLKDSKVVEGRLDTPRAKVAIRLSADGKAMLDGRAADLAVLEKHFRALAKTQPEVEVAFMLPADGGEVVRQSVADIRKLVYSVGFKRARVTLAETDSHPRK